MSTVGLQLLLFTLPLDLLINDVSLLELRFSRLIVLMVGYLPLWELISSSSARLRSAVRAVRSHHRRGESGFGSLLIDMVPEFMWSAIAFKPTRMLSLRVLSLINLKHKLLKRRPKQIITIKGNHNNHGVTVHQVHHLGPGFLPLVHVVLLDLMAMLLQ